MGFLDNKRILIVGVASKKSIAYGVAKAMHREGAQLAFTYQGDKLKSRVEDVAGECGSDLVMPLDVSSDDEISAVFDTLAASGISGFKSRSEERFSRNAETGG